MISRERRRDCPSGSDRSRAQSETLGFVLLFSLVIIGAVSVLALGAAAVSDSEEGLSADRAEKVMTQMDSEISMVALGRTDSQRMRIDRASSEKFSVDPESGTINITTVDEKGNVTDTIMNDTNLGAIVYENGDTVIAYQGGGVWRSDGGEGSGMVSPPEFNYREQTLTLPLVTVTGDNTLSREAVARKNGPSTRFFPDETKENLTNPLEDNLVRVTIETEYHDGWRSYFESRTDGDVLHEPENQRVTVNLTAPIVEGFGAGVKTTGGGITENKNSGARFENKEEGADAVSANSAIENEIKECKDGGDCTGLSDNETGTLTDGTYYFDGDTVTFHDKTTFDTSGGDIDVVVDGSVEFDGSDGTPDHEIVGDGEVTLYVRENFKVAGTTNVNTGGDADDLLALVHEEGEVNIKGDAQYTGLIYAPESEFVMGGGPGGEGSGYSGECGAEKDCNNVVGSVVAHSATAKGNGYLQHDPSARLLQLEEGSDTLTFLHISTNPVVVTDP